MLHVVSTYEGFIGHLADRGVHLRLSIKVENRVCLPSLSMNIFRVSSESLQEAEEKKRGGGGYHT